MSLPSALALVDQNPKSQGCNLWRCWMPFAALQRHGLMAEWGWNADVRTAMLADRFDLIVMPRLTWAEADIPIAETWLTALHQRGKLMISEWDDDVFRDGIVEREAGLFRAGTEIAQLESERRMRQWAVEHADGVTVASRHLADIVRRYTDAPIHVVPNALDLHWFDGVLASVGPRVAPPPTIGWFGGTRFDRDLAPMADAWGRVAAQRPDVTFVVIGHQPPVISQCVPANRLVRLAWLPVAEYPVNLVNVDIGCCPLAPEAFNRSKTPIKAIELGAARACVVASPTVYREVISPGQTGYLAETAQEWEAALLDALDNPARRRRLARNLRVRVERAHSLMQPGCWQRWPLAWEEIRDHARQVGTISDHRRSIIVPR